MTSAVLDIGIVTLVTLARYSDVIRGNNLVNPGASQTFTAKVIFSRYVTTLISVVNQF